MQTILITSQKGGSGKTTLTACLAVAAEKAAPGKVWMIDTDEQKSLSLWFRKRTAEEPRLLETPFARLAEARQKLAASGAGYLFIDSAPTRSEENAALIALADLVVIPVRPSPMDAWSAAATVDMAKKAGKPFRFVLNGAKANSRLVALTTAALSNLGPVSPVFIADRVAYAASLGTGATPADLTAKDPAAAEIAQLWADMQACLHANSQAIRSAANG